MLRLALSLSRSLSLVLSFVLSHVCSQLMMRRMMGGLSYENAYAPTREGDFKRRVRKLVQGCMDIASSKLWVTRRGSQEAPGS